MTELIQTFLAKFLGTLTEMAPYLLFGFFFAGLLSIFLSPELVERHLGGRGVWQVVKASLLGVPLPLCSCGVIPVAASLRRHGAGKGAVASFLVSTPQTGVDSILVTYSLLGLVFAVFRPVAAFVSGLVCGTFVTWLDRNDRDAEDGPPEPCTDACCADDRRENRFLAALHYGFVTLVADLAKPLVVGLVLAGLIAAVVPEDFLGRTLGTGLLSKLVMLAIGIPMYVCATASVPLALALIEKGITPGAALVFLMTGPATNAATIATLWYKVGKRTTVVYLASVAMTALAAGVILDQISTASGGAAMMHSHWQMPAGVGTVSAVALAGLVGYALLRPVLATAQPRPEESAVGSTIELAVQGMTCAHCVQTVERALRGVAGVEGVRIDLKRGRASVAGRDIDRAALARAVESAGYAVQSDGSAESGSPG